MLSTLHSIDTEKLVIHYGNILHKTRFMIISELNDDLTLIPLTKGDFNLIHWVRTSGVPYRYLFYVLAYGNLFRQKELETILSNYIKENSNPFVIKDFVNYYLTIAMHLIYYEYIRKYDLMDMRYYNRDIDFRLKDALSERIKYLKITDTKDGKLNGYVYDEEFEENTICVSSGEPVSITSCIALVEAIYIMSRYHFPPEMHDLVKKIFLRLSTVICGSFLQYRGAEKAYLRSYRANVLKALMFCNQLDETLSIGFDFIKHVSSIDPIYKPLFTLTPYYNCQQRKDLISCQRYSTLEGYIVLRHENNILEFVRGIPNQHGGYLNYGFNYIEPTYSIPFTGLSGQTVKNKVADTLICTAVPLNYAKTIFYTSHHTKQTICDGFYDAIIGLHEYTITFLDDVDLYIIIYWKVINSSSSYLLTSTRDDLYEAIALCNGVTYKITSTHPLDIRQEVLQSGNIRLVAPKKNIKYTIRIERIDDVDNFSLLIRPTIKRFTEFNDELMAIKPSTLKVEDFAIVTYVNNVFVIYTNYTEPFYQKDFIQSIVYKHHEYPMIMKSMRIYAQIS